jgi:hypothetical protein
MSAVLPHTVSCPEDHAKRLTTLLVSGQPVVKWALHGVRSLGSQRAEEPWSHVSLTLRLQHGSIDLLRGSNLVVLGHPCARRDGISLFF